MSVILHIDTATDHGSVGISMGDVIVASRTTNSQKEHAAFLQPAIADMCSELGIQLSQLDAVSVCNGPGSYTGLRVGLASAKGLCYALQKPLITIGTLQAMAAGAIKKQISTAETILFCPMIDARRMEVFTALYNNKLEEVQPPSAIIIDEDIFSDVLINQQIVFFGNGAVKLKDVLLHPHATIIDTTHSIADVCMLALQKFERKDFADIAYCEPFYLKPFFSTIIGK